MIGMDNDPATFGRPKSSTANIFLNSFMVQEMKCMAGILSRLGRPERAAHYRALRDSLIRRIQEECWDPRDRFFYSQDVDVKTRREELRATGSLHEYYNPFTGKPVMNGGFVNWNILALNMIEELRGKPAINLADS